MDGPVGVHAPKPAMEELKPDKEGFSLNNNMGENLAQNFMRHTTAMQKNVQVYKFRLIYQVRQFTMFPHIL